MNCIQKRKYFFFIHEARIYWSAILDFNRCLVPSAEFGFSLEVLYILKLLCLVTSLFEKPSYRYMNQFKLTPFYDEKKKNFQKARWFNETKARTNMQIKYYEKWNKFIVSWLWKACAFDSYTTMVVILLVYIKLFL